jgi:hypothetical protein
VFAVAICRLTVAQVNNWRAKSNCILADEMGLGKTAQSVCFINHLMRVENDPGPFLVRADALVRPAWQCVAYFGISKLECGCVCMCVLFLDECA